VCVRDWAPLSEIPDVLDQASMTAVPLTPEIAELVRAGAQITRDRADPSYQRPLPARSPVVGR